MQLSDALCCFILAICMTSECVESTSQEQGISKREAKLTRRDSSVIIGNFMDHGSYKPKVVYSKIARPRHMHWKTRHDLPKKYGKVKVKKGRPAPYQTTTYKRRPIRTRTRTRTTSTRHSKKPKIKQISKKRPPYYANDNVDGFAEPLNNYAPKDLPHEDNFGEPPVDSYGAPLLKPTGPYPTVVSDPYAENLGQYYTPNENQHNHQHLDNSYAYSKHVHTKHYPSSIEQDFMNSYSNIQKTKKSRHISNMKKRPHYYATAERPLRNIITSKAPQDQLLVGGQYAEPPGRYVPSIETSASSDLDSDDLDPTKDIIVPEITPSVGVSPYVNYKYSNMAFSPQNLNDVFSIHN